MKKSRFLPSLGFLPSGIVFFALFHCISVFAGTVKTYPLASCYTASPQYSIRVNSTDVPVRAFTSVYSYAHFSFSDSVTVTITASEPITSYNISPLAYNIKGAVSGNKLTFKMDTSRYLIVKINNLKDLAIAADPMEVDVPPTIGEGIFNVTQAPFHADPTGAMLSSKAIQSAIDSAYTRGGGIVYVPAGLFTISNLMLRSNVSLYLEGGCLLRAANDSSVFKTLFHKNSVGYDGTWLVYSETNATNMKVYGRGCIDGNGIYLRQQKKYLTNIFVPMQCSHLSVDGILFVDGGLWAFIPTRCDHLDIRNTKHFNENSALLEDDAIDIQESQNVYLNHIFAISEDDTYSTKTWEKTTDIAKNWAGDPEPLDSVVLDDCVAWSRCATYKIGFGVLQKQSNIVVRNAISYKSMRAIAINPSWGKVPAENVTFENIDVEGFWPRSGTAGKWLDVSTTAGPIKNAVVKNIRVRNVGTTASNITGNSTNHVNKITLENIYMGTDTLPATNLEKMNITNLNAFVDTIKIIPNVAVASDSLNLALNVPATASTTRDGNLAANSNDGKKYTRWTSEYNDSQWIYFDLGKKCSIDSVSIIWETACGKDFDLEVSNDANTWTTLKQIRSNTVLNNALGGLQGEGRYIRMKGIKRATSWGYSIWEFSVYGQQVDQSAIQSVTAKGNHIAVYPNPFRNELNIQLQEPINTPFTLQVENLAGMVVYQYFGLASKDLSNCIWDGKIASKPAPQGMYIVKFASMDQFTTNKVIKNL